MINDTKDNMQVIDSLKEGIRNATEEVAKKIIEINPNFDIENYTFKKLEEYLKSRTKFVTYDDERHIFNKAPKELTRFPTIVFKETNNTDAIQYRSTDRSQQVSQITDTIEIYTKDITIDGVQYASKIVMSELKYLVFDFFEKYGFRRDSCSLVEASDYQVDRLVIIERCYQNNWNRKIN